MWCVAENELVMGVKPAGPFPDHLHIAKPGLEGGLHVDMAPFLNGCPLPPACTAQKRWQHAGNDSEVHINRGWLRRHI